MANNFTITISAVDKATDVARKINKSLARITDPINNLGKETRALGEHFRVFGRMTGVTQVTKGIRSVGGAAKNAARSVASVVAPIGALTAAGAVAGIMAISEGFGRTSTAVRNDAATLGMPTQSLQAYQGAARLVGLASEDMAGGLKALGGVFEDSVTGRNLEAAGAMNQFGISVHRLKNGSIDTTRALRDIADVVHKMPNAQAQQKLASMFGVEQLLPLLQQGSAGIDKLVGKAKSIGAVLMPEQIAAGERYNEQMIEFDMTMQKLKWSIGNALLPAVERVSVAIESLVNRYGAIVASKVAEYAERISRWIDRADWGVVAGAVDRFVSAVGGVKTIAIAIAAITFRGPLRAVWEISKGLRRLAMTLVPMAIESLSKLGRARSLAAAAGHVAGESAAKNFIARLLPWVAKLGVPLWLATHSEGLDRGEEAYLTERRAKPGQAWGGDLIEERRRTGANADPSAKRAVLALEGMGWAPAQASGITAALWRGSMLDSGAVNNGGGLYGIGRWGSDSQEAFRRLVGIDIHKSTLGQQLQFVDYQLRRGQDRRVGERLESAATAADAGRIAASVYGATDNEERGVVADDATALEKTSTGPTMAPLYSNHLVAATPTQSGGRLSARVGSVPDVPSSRVASQELFVDIALKDAPPGTTARVLSAPPGAKTSVRVVGASA